MPDVAIAPSLPPIEGPGGCGAPDVVRLEAVVLPDRSRVALNPPATLRCTMAEAIVKWVRDEAVPRGARSRLAAARHPELRLHTIAAAATASSAPRLSEHGKANALDIQIGQAGRRPGRPA